MLTCLYPLAESAMVNLLPSLVKMGASSSSSQPPGEVITRLSPQSPCSAWHTLTTLQRAGGQGTLSCTGMVTRTCSSGVCSPK